MAGVNPNGEIELSGLRVLVLEGATMGDPERTISFTEVELIECLGALLGPSSPDVLFVDINGSNVIHFVDDMADEVSLRPALDYADPFWIRTNRPRFGPPRKRK